MALVRRHNFSHHHSTFLVLDKSITLPNEIIKSYAPELWVYAIKGTRIGGYVDLEDSGFIRGPITRRAVLVVLKALRNSEYGSGVATELQAQLNHALHNYAHLTLSPKRAMSKIFHNVAKMIYETGGHQEMAFAMSEWFSRYAADYRLDLEFMFRYIVALDQLRTSVTTALHTLLRQEHLTAADVRYFCRFLGPRSSGELKQLWKAYIMKRRPSPYRSISSSSGLVLGGDLSLKDIVRLHWEDPDSITIRLRPRRHRGPRYEFGTYDGSSANTDTDFSDDERYCPCPDCLIDGPRYVPHLLDGAPAYVHTPRPFSPHFPEDAHAGLMPARPDMMRSLTYPGPSIGGFLSPAPG